MADQPTEPKGAARELSTGTMVTIGGAPISYVAFFAAVLGVTSLIPFALMTTGKAFAVSELLIPLTGIILGPLGGFVAGLVGGFIGLFIAPYTATNGVLAPLTPALAAMAAGYFVQRDKRKWYGVVILVVALVVFHYKGVFINKVDPVYWLFVAHTVSWITLLISVTPLQTMFASWTRSSDYLMLVIGVVGITFMGTSTAAIINNGIGIWLFETPNDMWPFFFPIVNGERLIMTLFGSILGIAIILGLRRLRLVRPSQGGWYED